MMDNIVLFTNLVEVGSFSKTAEMVNLSQATLSKRIIELEEHIGKRLFVRDTRKMELTKEGLILYQYFKGLRRDLKHALRDINPESVTAETNSLNVLLPIALSYELICPYIGQFIKNNPKVKLNMFFQYSDPELLDNKFDIALTHYDFQSENYYTHFVRREIIQLYCTPHYVTKYGLPRTIEELEQHGVFGGMNLKTAEVEESVTIVNRYTQEKKIYNNLKYSRLNSNLTTHTKKIGMSMDIIFACWSFLCEGEVSQGKLIPVLPEYEIYSLSFYLVNRPHLSQAGNNFCEFLHQCLSRNPIRLILNHDTIAD